MNREQFIKQIMLRYAQYFKTEAEIQLWITDYEMTLHENIDFKQLYVAMLKGYMSSSTPPSPAWLLEKWREIRPRTANKPELEKAQEFRRRQVSQMMQSLRLGFTKKQATMTG
jgi:hypothetical protein